MPLPISASATTNPTATVGAPLDLLSASAGQDHRVVDEPSRPFELSELRKLVDGGRLLTAEKQVVAQMLYDVLPRGCDIDIVRTIASVHADIGFVKCADGQMPLASAIRANNLEWVHVFASNLSRSEATDRFSLEYCRFRNGLPAVGSCAPLHLAISERHMPTALALLDLGADPNQAISGGASKGMTPMHIAAMSEGGAMIQVLHARGVDLHAIDARGRTPAHMAGLLLDDPSMRTLRKCGADLYYPRNNSVWSQGVRDFQARDAYADKMLRGRRCTIS